MALPPHRHHKQSDSCGKPEMQAALQLRPMGAHTAHHPERLSSQAPGSLVVARARDG